jgi:hypothetical protein
MDKRSRLFFQHRSYLRSNQFPFTPLFHKCIGPDEFPAEQILLCFARADCSLADHDSRFAVNAHLQIVDLEFAKNDVAGHGLQICFFVHDSAIGPDNRAIVRLEPPRV